MNKIMLTALTLCALLLAGCGSLTADKEATLRLVAAASLEKALTQRLIPMYCGRYPQVKIEGTYDGSGKLQLQLEQGMQADIFIPASSCQLDALEQKGLVRSRQNLLHGSLALIVPEKGSGIKSVEDITKAKHMALGDPDSVPAGRYARGALVKLGLWDRVKSRASFGGSVTEVLQWVASGSADAGFVYASDTLRAGGVKVIGVLPEELLPEPIVYPLGIMKNSRKQEAERFAAFLHSAEAAAVFKEYGFEPVRAEEMEK